MTHTPGPWEIAYKDSDGFQIESSGRYSICVVRDINRTKPNEANAKLIAAAPELLEAIKAVLPYLKATGTNGNHWVPQIEAAIKKATV